MDGVRRRLGDDAGHQSLPTLEDSRVLVLFDIDGTICRTDGAGLKAMSDALRELHGKTFDIGTVSFAGRLDPLIWADIMTLNGCEPGDGDHDRFRERYSQHLETRLKADVTTRMPGVAELVEALAGTAVTLGLLTGNYAETGRLKIRASGLDPDRFVVNAWGDDADARTELPPVAMARFTEATGRAIRGEEVVIIGDTPHDVACATANGCRCIAVATGASSVDELSGLGATLVTEDLRETDRFVELVLDGSVTR
ncbi:MAG: HAD family hydrolase [Planctomycetota bacterium]